MKSKIYSLLLAIGLTGAGSTAHAASDTLRFEKNTFFKEGQSLEAYAGSVIELGPGVLLLIEGSLCLEGSAEKPIRIINSDPENPGVGIQIQAQSAYAAVKIRNVEFEDLTQALRFDPFWYRKEVILEQLHFQGSTSGEPVLYLGDPYIDRRWGRSIDLKVKDLLFVNNRSGMVVEAYGSPLVNYDFDQIHFRDNYFEGPEQALVHFDLYPEERQPQEIGTFIFDRNRFEEDDYLISVGGNFEQELKIKSLAAETKEVSILDHRVDHRLAQLEVIELRPLETKEATDFKILKHVQDSIQMQIANVGQKNLMFTLLDEAENSLEYELIRQKDHSWVIYTEGPAKFLELADGYRIILPKPDLSEVLDSNEKEDLPVYAEEELRDTTATEENTALANLGNRVHNFFTKGTTPVNRWEVGIWGGGGMYGAGDIKPKFELAEDLVYIPSTIDWSFGAYAQYNFNTRFAAKASFYHTTISMHDLSSIGFFSGTAPLMGYDDEYQEVEMAPNSYPVSFITQIRSLEVEGIWHLRQYQLKPNQKSKLIPSLGLSIGAFHFTPYRTLYTPKEPGEDYLSYLSRVRENRYNLRDLGSEGQNFLPGAKPYSQIAVSTGLSFSTTWLFRNFSLKGEVKAVYTSTDYLDDFGPGLWYGGDLEAMRASQQYGDIPKADLINLNQPVDLPRENTFRSTDGINDWYFQAHLGLSYFLDKPKEKPKLPSL